MAAPEATELAEAKRLDRLDRLNQGVQPARLQAPLIRAHQ